MAKPLDPKDAKQRIKKIIKEGRVIYSRPHALDRLKERNLSMVDCENVLRGGSVSKPYQEGGNWRHKVTTPNIEVVIQFLPYNQLLIVTVWRKGSGK